MKNQKAKTGVTPSARRGDDSATSVRPQLPDDPNGMGDGNKWSPGKLPKGGFMAVIPFNTMGINDSCTSKPEKKTKII